MAVIAVQDYFGDAVVFPTLVAATGGGDTVAVGYRTGGGGAVTHLHVNNGGAGAITVTVTMPNGTVVGPVSVGAGLRALIKCTGVTPGQIASVAYSGVTSVTVGAAREWPLGI